MVKLTSSCFHSMQLLGHPAMYIQRAAISHDIPGIICIKKKKQLFFCRGMCTDEDIVKCLIPFHDMTGCDANTCFYGHGKMLLYKKMAKSLDARSLLLKCVQSLSKNDVQDNHNSYVICYMYGNVQSYLNLPVQRNGKGRRRNL